jgi:hypothetical protein
MLQGGGGGGEEAADDHLGSLPVEGAAEAGTDLEHLPTDQSGVKVHAALAGHSRTPADSLLPCAQVPGQRPC